MSLEVKRGEKIGVVGLSGAGKSTLFKLLLKEYESFTGAITFDSTPIQHIKKSDYFNHVAVVLQDTEVFNFSLKDNVTVANDAEKDNEELLQRSLDIAHVTDFLHKLPHGTDTVIGEKGVKLSGGEKQRLGIARAIFKQPQLLLLDEATSHLDLESEEKIKDSLHTFFENVTAIVIAHRLTTIKAMDKIIVIENGQLVEQGNFDELYKKQGRFFELWEKQKL
jgi:ABC-type multidrug transport system fused ATPase/permease subunit